ncbi:hypothetical protein N7528_006846 [Penicillium herquei]|nr:hypothetical protein N7528_006846 [Penicillium herquei]
MQARNLVINECIPVTTKIGFRNFYPRLNCVVPQEKTMAACVQGTASGFMTPLTEDLNGIGL